MKIGLKIIESKFYLAKIYFKRLLFFFSNKAYAVQLVDDLLETYSAKKKIVVLCNGPSANLCEPKENALYLVTNSGKRLVENYDYLFYLNDPLYVQRVLSNPNFLDDHAPILFYYNHTELHKKNLNFLIRHIALLKKKKLYFLSSELKNVASLKNFEQFIAFYEEKSLKVKVQNSGMFILLFGYYMAQKLNLPLEIYGLDMGEGGKRHFDGKGIIGSSVTEERIKKNVKLYLDFMYSEYSKKIQNHSYFNSNLDI